MKMWLTAGVMALLLFALAGCRNGSGTYYYNCPQCGAAYKQEWYQTGLPGQVPLECRLCGSKLRRVPKHQSNWDESRPADPYP